MTLRRITAADTWPIRHQVLWPDQPLDFVQLPEDEAGQHFGLFIEEQLVSIISLFGQEERVQFRKFATLEAWQGKGCGTYLLQHIIDKELAEACRVLWCNARTTQQGFYERFGLMATDKTYTKAGIDFVIMEKNVRRP